MPEPTISNIAKEGVCPALPKKVSDSSLMGTAIFICKPYNFCFAKIIA
jgi:hypothetical protein